MRALSMLSVCLLAACDFGLAEIPTIENSCGGDADCEVGVCDGGICVDDSGASVTVAIEVLRGPTNMQSSAPSSWAYPPESLSGSISRDLALPSTREVRGLVRWDGAPVPATLRFVRRMDPAVAPLTAAPVEVDTLRDPVIDEGAEPYDFSAVLVTGATYDVSVVPTTDIVMAANQVPAAAIRSLPPVYFELLVTGETTLPFRFDIEFPPTVSFPCNEDFNAGCTLSAEVFSVKDQVSRPEPGLQVRAIDEETGRLMSSIAETDELGRFSIRLSDQVSRYLIRITSTAGQEPFPSVSVDPETAFVDDPEPKRILIPRLDAVQFTGRVRDIEEKAVPGATVRFSSTGIFGGGQLGLQGAFSGSATTDAEGVFGTELLPGFYSITVTPPEDAENDWGVFSEEFVVGEEDPQVLTLPSQVDLSGLISTFRDESAAGVTVLARGRPAMGSESAPRSQETVSNELGGFAMSVDAGRYDVQVKVPSETGYAWAVEPDMDVADGVGRTYQLAPPISVVGTIRTSTTVPVPDALVRAYVLSETEAGPRSIQVAETTTAADGSYNLLIAPRFAAP